jgi:hypothetical protein
LSDYDRQVLKTQRAKKKTASEVPQLGTQSKKSIPDLKVLSTFDRQVSEFNKDTGLTAAQNRGEDAIPTHEGHIGKLDHLHHMSNNCLILPNPQA